MNKLFQVSVSLVIMGMLLTACGPFVRVANGLGAPSPQPTTGAVDVPTIAPTAPIVLPTIAPSTGSGGDQSCTDSAEFVSDVSIPDNVLFSPNTPFTKTWRLKNTGTCTWDSSYLVYWISGATMSQQPGYPVVPAGQSVKPGETVDVSVGMTSPADIGYYTAYWGLKSRDGQWIPIARGAGGNSFFVKIRVNDSGASGLPGARIVDQIIDIELEQGSGEACTAEATYLVHAYVKADGPLSALYEIDSTAGQISAGYFVDASGAKLTTVEGTVKFDASLFAADGAPTVTIPLRFVGPYPYPKDIQVNFWVDGGQWVHAKVQCP